MFAYLLLSLWFFPNGNANDFTYCNTYTIGANRSIHRKYHGNTSSLIDDTSPTYAHDKPHRNASTTIGASRSIHRKYHRNTSSLKNFPLLTHTINPTEMQTLMPSMVVLAPITMSHLLDLKLWSPTSLFYLISDVPVGFL